MALISSNIVLLLFLFTIPAFSLRSHPATWGKYIDTICTTCMSSRAHGVLPKMKYLVLCVDYQRTNLHCVSPTTFLSLNGQRVINQDKPCGIVSMSHGFVHHQHWRWWAVTVHPQFYLNFTFLTFVLAMPYGKCDLHQGSENLMITSKKVLFSKNMLSFCGERSAFSVLWKDSYARLVFRSMLTATEAGRFLIQYQVCDKNEIILKPRIVHHELFLEPVATVDFRIGLRERSGFQNGKNIYIMHFLGNRLKVLDVSLDINNTNNDSITVHAFEGPGPAETHRHPHEAHLIDGRWIHFQTFQGCLRIERDIKARGQLFIEYQWHYNGLNEHIMKINEPFHFNDIGKNCTVDDAEIWYCFYLFESDRLENMQITLDHVSFAGPNYLGDFSEYNNCLLAGVTIVDNYRLGVMHDPEQHSQHLGDVPIEMAIDYVLPEITTCYQVPFADGDDLSQTTLKLPLGKIVSTSPWINLLVYAYGAYIDLKRSIIKLTIRPTDCIGLVLSCGSIPSDGFLDIGSVSFDNIWADQKEAVCPFGNMLKARIYGPMSPKFSTEIMMCTTGPTGEIMVVPHLITSHGVYSGSCLFVQLNPYALTINDMCSVTVNDLIDTKPLNYDVYMQEPRNLYCKLISNSLIPMAVGVETHHNSTKRVEQDKNKLNGNFVMLYVDVVPNCFKLEITTSLQCAKSKIQENPPIIQTVENELQQMTDIVACKHYSVSARQNYTHVLYKSPVSDIRPMIILIESKQTSQVDVMRMNYEIGQIAWITSFRLNENCSLNCGLFKVQIAYWSLAAWEAVLLEWQIFVKTNSYEIHIFDIPFSETLIYITPLRRCEKQSCFLDVDFKFTGNKTLPFPIASDKHLATFAEYVLYWTSREYNWYEAEDVCRQTGDMHLASITNEEEYILVQGILAGDTSVAEFQLAAGILTPCRLGSLLCSIYIGLQVNRSTLTWKDGRPHGFIPFPNDSPVSITVLQEEHEQNPQQVGLIKPQGLSATSSVSCTMLKGSPGPKDMDFINVSCDQLLEVSGILCIRGGQIMQHSHPNYRITHLKRRSDSDVIFPSKAGGTNVILLHEAGSKVADLKSKLTVVMMEDTQTDELIKQMYQNSTLGEESWLACNQTSVVCKILNANGEIHKITQKVRLVADSNKPPTIGSVYMSHGSLTTSDYCPELTFLTNNECVGLVDKPAIRNIVSKTNVDQICTDHLSGSRVYAFSPSASDKEILRKLTERRPALSVDKNETVFVIISDEKEVHVYPNFGDSSEVRLILCSIDPLPPRCPVHYTRCNNGCISDMLVCDGKIDCEDGKDESECHNLCQVLALTTSVVYCLNECHPDNCSCSDLYFQCQSGGCLHSSKLCDGTSDCQDMSDESICTKHFYQTNTKSHYVEINLLTQNSVLDEMQYTHVMNTLENEPVTNCSTLNHLQCMIGHPACYPVDKRCVYDHTDEGELKYCKTGRHLHSCQNVNCSGSFKCYNSYCVPAHKVCNDELDCPYGDDERFCPVKECYNMLRCGDLCVHPIDICDGTSNCKHGEDELLCDLPECPHGCTCNGYAMRCTSATMFDASSKHIRIMSLKYSQNDLLTPSTFANLVDLLFLDMAYCNIDILPQTTIFVTQNALIKLDLSHNVIKHLIAGSLSGLSNLQELDLSLNPLNSLDSHVLDELVNLRVLSLSHCEFIYIPYIVLLDNHALDILDMSHAKIIDFGFCAMKANLLIISGTLIRVTETITDNCWGNVTRVVSDQQHLCCLGMFADHCETKGLGHKATCQPLLWHQILVVYSLFLIVTIVVCNVCVLLYKACTHDVDTPLVCNLTFANTLVIIPLVLFTHWHLSHGTRIAFFEPFLAPNAWCSISGYVLTGVNHLSTLFSLLICLVKYCGIVRMKNILADHKQQFYVVIICGWSGFASISVMLEFNDVDTATTFSDCLFGHAHSIKRQLLLGYSATNMAITFVNMCLCGSILKEIWLTLTERTIGQKHGGDSYFSSVSKLIAIIVCSSVAVISQSVFLTYVYFVTDISSQSIVSCIIVLFPLQSMCNPFLYTLCTRRFATTFKNLLFKWFADMAMCLNCVLTQKH